MWEYSQPPKIERGEFGTQYIVGTLRYNSDRQLSYASVTCQVLQDGVQVADALDNASGLQPNSQWRFKAMLLDTVSGPYNIKCQASGF